MNYKGFLVSFAIGVSLTGLSNAADIGDLLMMPIPQSVEMTDQPADPAVTDPSNISGTVGNTAPVSKKTTQKEKKHTALDTADHGNAKTADVKNQSGEETGKAGATSTTAKTPASKDNPIKMWSDSTVTAYVNNLDTLTISPLQPGDFFIGSIRSGDAMQKVKRIFGTPSKYSQSSHFTTMRYDDTNLDIWFIIRNDTMPILKQTVGERKAVRIGVDSAFLAKGQDIVMSRDIHLKYSAEVLVRQFGIPTDILRDADANVYYFVYMNPNGHDMMVFALGNRKIERVALMPPRYPYVTGMVAPDKNKRLERDFTLMGFGIGKPFQPNKYNMWNSLVKRHGNDFWLYGDYGVEVDRRSNVAKVFLLTNNGYTSRGATLGYHISTVLALYGHPNRVEIGPEADKSVDAYYYDSPFQKGVSLVFVVKHNEQYVDDVILLTGPITALQDPMSRYGLR